jgi:polyphosphate kinase
MKRPKLDDPRHYLNRHVQWLEFNRRVLEEARDIGNPLLERVKFLAITANNLDEFVEIRVSSFLQRIEHGSREISPDGLTAEEELKKVSAAMHIFVRDQYKCWNNELLPALAKQSIWVLSTGELNAKAAKFTKTFYDRRVNPMLTPVTVDPSHPFPHVLNKALCIAFLLRRRRGGNGKPYFGVLTVPRALPRLLRVPTEDGGIRYAFLQDIISTYASRLYRGYEILAFTAFRITRNSNLYLEQEESRRLLETVDSQVAQRRKGDAVRLEIEEGAHPDIVERLVSTFELDDSLVFRVRGPVNLQRLFHLYEETKRPDLKYPPFVPRQIRVGHDADSLFETLRRQDVLVHHPYESYDTVVNFLRTANHDPRVLSMKQTLYRTNNDSPVAQALLEAAGKKEVTVVVELKASSEEATNIHWARSLEDAGVQVFHGLANLKTHAKLALVVRNDPDGKIRRYVHLGTGNYNPSTARFYSDFSLLTSDDAITSAVPRRVQLFDRVLRATQLQAADRGAARHGQDLYRVDRPGSAPCAARAPRADARQDECGGRSANHSGALSSLPSGSGDRSDRARTERAGSRRPRPQQPHTRAQYRRALPGAQPHLLFRKWRKARAVSRQRRLDAAKSLRASRSHLSGERSPAVPAYLQ